jgi:hypothetical protein
MWFGQLHIMHCQKLIFCSSSDAAGYVASSSISMMNINTNIVNRCIPPTPLYVNFNAAGPKSPDTGPQVSTCFGEHNSQRSLIPD